MVTILISFMLTFTFPLSFTPGIVIEDAPSGIRSGRAAGCKTIALLTTHTREQVDAAQPDFIIKDLSWRVFHWPYDTQAY